MYISNRKCIILQFAAQVPLRLQIVDVCCTENRKVHKYLPVPVAVQGLTRVCPKGKEWVYSSKKVETWWGAYAGRLELVRMSLRLQGLL